MSFKLLKSENSGLKNNKQCDDGLHLKLQLLFYKLNKKQCSNQYQMTQNRSATKFSKVTFRMDCQESHELIQIKSIKQQIQLQFQAQTISLNQHQAFLKEKYQQQASRRQIKIKQIKRDAQIIEQIFLKIKNITNQMNQKRRFFKGKSLIKTKQKNKNYVQKTPNRQTFTPFQKDNSLLISVKRSMIDEANLYNSIKNSEKQFITSNEYKFSQIMSNPVSNPFISTVENKEKNTTFKDFIKETEEDQRDESFEILSSKIRYQFKAHEQKEDNKLQKFQRKIIQTEAAIEKLSQQINEQKKQCQAQWEEFQHGFTQQVFLIYDLLSNQAKNRESLYLDRQQMFNLLQQSIQNALVQQKRSSKRQHLSIIQNLHKMIQFFI